MTKPRRPRTDSTANLTRILAVADTELAPPATVPLQGMDWPFWHSIVDEYARADWSDHQLEIAAMLARTMAALEESQRLLRDEGAVIVRPSGATGPNPRNRIVSTLTAQVLAFRRSLALTGRAKAGSSVDAARRREANRDAERGFRSTRDDLLA